MVKRIILLLFLLSAVFAVVYEARLPKPEIIGGGQATSSAKITAGEVATVKFVLDGDTIELTDGRRVRYIGVDAPETAHEGKPAECYSEQSRKENEQRVKGKSVRLEKDTSDTDSYGRLLRYVFVGDTLINELLVRGGFARAWNVPPDEKYKNTLHAFQEEAVTVKRGMWGVCLGK